MRRVLILLLSAMLFASVAARAEQPMPPGLLRDGVSAYEQGRFDEALSLLRGYVIRYPQAGDLSTAYAYLSRTFLAEGDISSARLYYERIPPEDRTNPVRFIEARLQLAEQHPDKALELLRLVPSESLAENERLDWYGAFAAGAQQSGAPLQALAALQLGVRRHGMMAGKELLQQAHAIGAELGPEELREGAFMLQESPVGLDLSLYLARQAFSQGDRDRALGLVEGIIASPLSFPWRQEATVLYDRLRGQPWVQRAIGVLLPETGRFASFGELLRRGVDLASQLHDRELDPVKLIFRDSGGDPDRAREAVRQFANEDRVMAVLGPISGVAAEAAAYQAELDGVPMLSLSQRAGIPQIGPQVFRFSLTNRNQAAELARYAIDQLGYSSFGVLYPETPFGREMTELFSEETLKRNGMVIVTEGYEPDATDFRTQVRLLMGEDPTRAVDIEDLPEQDQLEALFEPEFPPVDFDALFIPDYPDRVALIAPQLPFYGMEGVPLLGISGWNAPELVRNAGKSIDGAVFVDGFFRHSSFPFVRDFVDLYFATYGEEPTILEAQGFDAANILLSLLDQAWIADRGSLRDALSRFRNYPGVTGATSFNADGDAEKQLYLLQIQRGNAVQLN